jgi:B12-binding domain/radical SAM domain protein
VPRRATLLLVGTRPRRAAVAALAGAVTEDPRGASLEVGVAEAGAPLAAALGVAAARGPVVVGWSLTTADRAPAADSLARLRGERPGPVWHVAGGPHPSAAPSDALAAGFDLAAVGEGEETLVALCERVAAGGDPRGPGLAWMDGAEVRRGPAAPEVDLERVPPFAERLGYLGPIEITRGCVHACRFCQTADLHGARPRHRSPARVAGWVGALSRAGMRDVRFLSPSALAYGSPDGSADLDAVEELLRRSREAIGPAGRLFLGSFPSEVRPEHVTPEGLRLLRRHVANDNLVIGAQSGSEAVLRACRRGHGVEEVRRATRLALEAGFRAKVDLIFGLPGEAAEDAAASRALARELAALGAEIHAHAFLPLPGSAWAGAPHGRVDAETRRELERLAGWGLAYGQWKGQEARDPSGRRPVAEEP